MKMLSIIASLLFVSGVASANGHEAPAAAPAAGTPPAAAATTEVKTTTETKKVEKKKMHKKGEKGAEHSTETH